jgi:hypothetical protein
VKQAVGHVRFTSVFWPQMRLANYSNIDALSTVLIGLKDFNSLWKDDDIWIDGVPVWSSVPASCGVLYTREAAAETRREFLTQLHREGFSFEDRWKSGEIRRAGNGATLKSLLQSGFALTAEKCHLGGRWFTTAIFSPTPSEEGWSCVFYINGESRVSFASTPVVALHNAVDDVGHFIRQAWPDWCTRILDNPLYLEVRTPRELGRHFREEWVQRWDDVVRKHVGELRSGDGV